MANDAVNKVSRGPMLLLKMARQRRSKNDWAPWSAMEDRGRP